VLAEQSAGVFTVPPGLENQTLLGLLGFSSTADLSSFVIANGPQAYLQSNARYYACGMAGANILLAIFAIMFMGEGFSMAGQPWQYFNLGRQAAARVLTIIARVPTIDSFSEEGLKPASVKGDIEVRDVRFAYPTAPDHLVCKGYSLSIRAGETVALCGPSGSGKSTIIQLLERFYDPQSGTITLDGVNLKDLNVRWLRQQLGLVSQEPVLFMGSVSENIRYGKKEATQVEVEEAARSANAYDFITTTLSDGFDTQVGQGGGKLSGGQKQRVAIARALVKKPSVLLLDEATSALDNESERIVQAALDEIMTKQKRTTIVIAHRLSTIRNADKIVVLQEGAVAEQGTHDELLANPEGLYFNLVLAQQ
jgi:ATP-binding cassette subfamily B (MDR/TAP) protein 1